MGLKITNKPHRKDKKGWHFHASKISVTHYSQKAKFHPARTTSKFLLPGLALKNHPADKATFFWIPSWIHLSLQHHHTRTLWCYGCLVHTCEPFRWQKGDKSAAVGWPKKEKEKLPGWLHARLWAVLYIKVDRAWPDRHSLAHIFRRSCLRDSSRGTGCLRCHLCNLQRAQRRPLPVDTLSIAVAGCVCARTNKEEIKRLALLRHIDRVLWIYLDIADRKTANENPKGPQPHLFQWNLTLVKFIFLLFHLQGRHAAV